MKTREELARFIKKCDTDVLQRVKDQPCTATDPEMKQQNALCHELIALELQRREAQDSAETQEESKEG